MEAINSGADHKGLRTIVHEILDSDLPPAEKSFARVQEEVSVVTGAGFETLPGAVRLIIYHIYSNTSILQRFRSELLNSELELKTLERKPYLTAVIMEGLRLSPGVASRTQRIALDRDLVYKQWTIPAGTPVGMTQTLLHTDPVLYPSPMQFDPERWLDHGALKKAEKTYMPFSRGTRNCLGMQ
jgi:cytochrome P450